MSVYHQIQSLTNPTVKAVRALHMRKTREESGQFIAEGLKFVIEALDQGVYPEVLFFSAQGADHPLTQRAIKETLAARGKVYEVTRDILEKVSRKDNPQMVVAVFRQNYTHLDDIDLATQKVWVALEEVRDPGNLGTIIRTADAAGLGGVILIGDTCDPFSVEAVRATMGSVFALPIIRCRQDEFIAFRKGWTGSVVGTLLTATFDHKSAPYQKPTLIVMGTEQSGLSPQVASICDVNVKIPMRGRADSLNLAVATGIMIYAATDV